MLRFWFDDLLGLEGLDEARDEGLGEGFDVLDVDRLADVLFDLVELGVCLFLAALAGFTGVLNSGSFAAIVKLNSFMGDTEDLLLATVDLRVDCDLEAERFALLAEAVVFFLMEAGVVFALDDLGLGVPLMGFEDLLAGVAVCLAIMFVALIINN